MIHSYSSLSMFEKCPHQFYQVRVLKAYPYQPGPEAQWGDYVHQHLERVGTARTATPPVPAELPPDLASYSWIIDNLVPSLPGTKLFEFEFNFNRTWHNVGARDWSAKFWTGKGDVIAISEDRKTGFYLDYKGFPLDTRVPTPEGFTTMGALEVGDYVLGSDGVPTQITHKSATRNRPFHVRVTFTDGATIVCDDDHRWALASGEVVEAQALPVGAFIPLTEPAQHTTKQLPVDPWVLGLWLGDGKHTSGEVSKPDDFVFHEAARRGYPVNMQTGGLKECPTRTLQGLAPQLRRLGVLGAKHIPDTYLHADIQQRLDLLRGLMDSDGYANPGRRQCVFTSVDHAFVQQVAQLVASLGMRPTVHASTRTGFGLSVMAYDLAFTPRGLNPFSLPRKASVAAEFLRGRGHPNRAKRRDVRVVKAVDRVPATPSQCIAVAAADNLFLVGDRYLVTHNTGSDRYPDTDQLELMAVMMKASFATLEHIRAGLLFTQTAKPVVRDYTLHQIPALRTKWEARAMEVELAKQSNTWPMKPGPLCPYCPHKSCVNWKPPKAKA